MRLQRRNAVHIAVTLLLGPLRASHLYREDHIVYSSSGENMGTYEYQRWAEPPTEMLVDVLLRDLRASGKYRAVDVLRSNSHGDYILYGRLYDFKEISASPLDGPRYRRSGIARNEDRLDGLDPLLLA